jgi:hypothetical protein
MTTQGGIAAGNPAAFIGALRLRTGFHPRVQRLPSACQVCLILSDLAYTFLDEFFKGGFYLNRTRKIAFGVGLHALLP